MVFKKTFILALILLILGAYFYFFEIKEAKKKAAEAEKANKVFVFNPQEVEELRLVRFGATVICRHQNDDDSWTIKETMGNKEGIEALLTSLSGAKLMRIVEENPENLKIFGLEPPKVEMAVRLKDGSSLPVLFLGNNNLDASGIYGKLSNSPRVFIVDGTIRRGLMQELYPPTEEKGDKE